MSPQKSLNCEDGCGSSVSGKKSSRVPTGEAAIQCRQMHSHLVINPGGGLSAKPPPEQPVAEGKLGGPKGGREETGAHLFLLRRLQGEPPGLHGGPGAAPGSARTASGRSQPPPPGGACEEQDRAQQERRGGQIPVYFTCRPSRSRCTGRMTTAPPGLHRWGRGLGSGRPSELHLWDFRLPAAFAEATPSRVQLRDQSEAHARHSDAVGGQLGPVPERRARSAWFPPRRSVHPSSIVLRRRDRKAPAPREGSGSGTS